MAEESHIKAAIFKIFHNGSELSDDLLSAVEKVVVEDEINLPSMFVIGLNIVDFMNGTWRGIDLEEFKLGDEIKILMGMGEATEMVVGDIAALEPTFGSPSFMEIRGFDRLHKLRFGTFRRSFKEMKDSDVASSIASDAGLSPDVEDTETTHEYLFQNNLSNFDFLAERARRIDFEMLAKNNNFIFRKSQEDKAPELELNLDSELEQFSARLKAITQGSKIEIRGWDVKKKEEISAFAEAGSEKSKMNGDETGYEISEAAFGASETAVVSSVVADSKDAENQAKAWYNARLKGFLAGEGEGPGNALLRAGMTVEIKGVGEKFSGPYYVTSSAHSFSFDAGYKTKFKAKRTGL